MKGQMKGFAIEYYSFICKKELSTDTCYNMKLNNIVSERIQTPKATYCIIHVYEMSRRGKSLEMESTLVVAKGSRCHENGGDRLVDK